MAQEYGEGDDDLAFYGYVVTTIDPSPYLLLATIAFCVAINIALFWLVYTRRHLPCLTHLTSPLLFLESHQIETPENLEGHVDQHAIDEQVESANQRKDHGDGDNDDGASSYHSSHDDMAWETSSFVSASSGLCHYDFPRMPRGRRRRGRYNPANVHKLIDLELMSEQESQISGHWNGTNLSILGDDDHASDKHVEEGSRDFNVEIVLGAPRRKSTIEASRELLDKILDLFEWNYDTKRILRLAIPFVSQSIGTGVSNALLLVIVGRLLGSRALSAFVVVNLMVQLSTKVVGGFHEAMTSLCSHASGNKNTDLMGQYFQISCIFYVIFIIPITIFWYFFMAKTLEWMDFDKETVQIGQAYANILLIDVIFKGPIQSVHSLLDVIGLEQYSTLIGIFEEVTALLAAFLVAFFFDPSLRMLGLIRLLIGLLVLCLNVGIIAWRGWFEPYMGGICGSCALKNFEAAKLMFKTGATLSIGYILTEGEWEILTLFASFLGPAEVAAWGILGTIWDSFEIITESFGDAAEIRCAYLLSAGEPKRAETTAYKAILIGLFLSTFITSLIYIAGDSLPTWVTDDAALQHIIVEVLPLFGLGSICLIIGQLCWTILGSQGRYRLATMNAFLGSCFVTIPLSALFSLGLNLNLEGQTAAVVVGYTVSGALNAYIIFTSDWEALSTALIKKNELELHLLASRLEPIPEQSKEFTETNSPSELPTQPQPEISTSCSRDNQHRNTVDDEHV